MSYQNKSPFCQFESDAGTVLSEGEEQEAGEDAEVSGVVINSVAGWQNEAHNVALLQLQSHTIGHRGVAAMIIQPQVKDDWLVVPVQVHTHVTFEVICSSEAEEVQSSDRSCEYT